MKPQHFFVAVLVYLGCVVSTWAQLEPVINWQSPINRMMLTSTGQPWNNSFQFELGVFDAGFIPTAANTEEWAAHWNTAQTTGYNSLNSNFAGSYTVYNNNPPFQTNTPFYIWGYSGTKTAGEWFLASKSDWKWPVAGVYKFVGASTGSALAIVGTINTDKDAPFHIQTAAIGDLPPPQTTWAEWAMANLGEIPPPGPSGDLNHNGIIDAWEFALQSPTTGVTPNPGDWMEVVEVDGVHYLQIRIPRDQAHPATFIVEVTSDLTNGPWLSGPTHTSVIEDTVEALVIRDNTPMGSSIDRRFMRVGVVVTP